MLIFLNLLDNFERKCLKAQTLLFLIYLSRLEFDRIAVN